MGTKLKISSVRSAAAIRATAIKRQLMLIGHEPGRHQIIQITGAGMDVKYPATVTTREVVVMAMGKLKSRIFPR
jgi:hypothetical protein